MSFILLTLPVWLAGYRREHGAVGDQEREMPKTPEAFLDASLFLSAYEELFDDVSGNIRLGILFAAAFAAFLHFLMKTELLVEEAEAMGEMILTAKSKKPMI